MKVFTGVAELEKAVGTHLGYSTWHAVSQQQIDMFAQATCDYQWIHIDAEKAALGPFGTTIAHGYLTLSLVPMLVCEVYSVDAVRMAVNYGANKLRFPSPVPVDSKVRAGVQLVSVTPAAGGYQVVTRVTVERDGGTKPVCIVDTVTLLVP
jgi:acyl dehydratase